MKSLKSIAQNLRDLADELDFQKEAGEYWTIDIPQGLTIEQAYKNCEKLFPCWKWTQNFDKINSDRTSKKAYSIKVKANIEADENLKNLSANDLTEKGIQGITLLERLVLEKDYFQKTGQHLDIQNITLCAGSRSSDGRVPRVCWDGGKLYVGWDCVDGRHDGLRSREVILTGSYYDREIRFI